MLTSYRVENFRSFDHFVVESLARVNLYVGGNNSGKTSLLEAAELLLSADAAKALTGIPGRRGEDLATSGIDISHLFHGHRAEVGSKIEIAEPHNPKHRVALEIVAEGLPDFGTRQRARRAVEPAGKEPKATLAVRVDFGDGSESLWLPAFLRDDMLIVDPVFSEERAVPPVRTVGAEAESPADLWERIVLTAEETKATEALRVIEPEIDRIAAGAQGFFVRMAGSDKRIPLGSMGDGIRRMLNLSVHLATASNGTLLVDEIDTGLHYSVMTRMWRLVIETARRLNVQVLATTHSGDCIRSLARLCEETPELGPEVALHRVVRGASSTVRYGAEELQAAAQVQIEVR